MNIRFILSFETRIASVMATHVWKSGEDPNEIFSVMDNFEPDVVLKVGENELSFLLADGPIKINIPNHTYDVWLARLNQSKKKELFVTNDELLAALRLDPENWEIEETPLPKMPGDTTH